MKIQDYKVMGIGSVKSPGLIELGNGAELRAQIRISFQGNSPQGQVISLCRYSKTTGGQNHV